MHDYGSVINPISIQRLMEHGIDPDLLKQKEVKMTSTVAAGPTTPSATIPKTPESAAPQSPHSPNTFEFIKSSLLRGGHTGLADETATIILDMVKAIFGKNVPEFLNTPDGQEIGKILMATGLIFSADLLTANQDHQQIIKENAGLVIEASFRDFIQPKVAQLKPMVEDLISKRKPPVPLPPQNNNNFQAPAAQSYNNGRNNNGSHTAP